MNNCTTFYKRCKVSESFSSTFLRFVQVSDKDKDIINFYNQIFHFSLAELEHVLVNSFPGRDSLDQLVYPDNQKILREFKAPNGIVTYVEILAFHFVDSAGLSFFKSIFLKLFTQRIFMVIF